MIFRSGLDENFDVIVNLPADVKPLGTVRPVY